MSVCLAQTTYTGKVIDTKNIPVAFANVIVYKSSDRSVKEGTITDENGNFCMVVATYRGVARVSLIGADAQDETKIK